MAVASRSPHRLTPRRTTGRRRTPASRPSLKRLPRGFSGRLKGWLDLDGEFFLGPRYIRLLEGIERTGTIQEGCRETGMSYRTCRNRIKRMEEVLGSPLVLTSRGGEIRGRATLTPAARQLIRIYRRWRGDVERVSRRAFAQAIAAVR
jgi:molybdate transport system regulatory protein